MNNTDAAEAPSWIGARPSAAQIFALMFCGVTGLMVAGLEPLLLGGLAEAGRVSSSELGAIATAELLTMGLTAGAAGSFLKAARLKLIAIGALIALGVIDALTPTLPGDLILPVRALAGAPSGLLVWITIALIARSPTPERWAGIYLTAQTAGQFAMAALLTASVTPHYGIAGAFVALAVLCAVNIAAAFALPDALAPLPAAAIAGLPGLRGWTALGASFLFLAASSGVWVYLERFSNQAHHAPAIAGQAVSISLAFQIAGGLTATLLAGRVHWFGTLLACALIDLCVLVGLSALPAPVPFIALGAALGFVWLFASAFLVPMTIEADPTRRAALLIGGAQLVGGSLGPLFASFFVTNADARGALAFAGAAIIAAAAIIIAIHLTRKAAS